MISCKPPAIGQVGPSLGGRDITGHASENRFRGSPKPDDFTSFRHRLARHFPHRGSTSGGDDELVFFA